MKKPEPLKGKVYELEHAGGIYTIADKKDIRSAVEWAKKMMLDWDEQGTEQVAILEKAFEDVIE